MTKKRAVPRHHRLGYRVPEFLRRLWQKSVEDEVFFMAGAIAFNVLIALVVREHEHPVPNTWSATIYDVHEDLAPVLV